MAFRRVWLSPTPPRTGRGLHGASGLTYPADVDPSITSAAAGLGGALIAGSATIAAGWLQQKRQTKNDRLRELREHQEDAARTCQQALWDIEAVLDENFDLQLEDHNFKNALKLEICCSLTIVILQRGCCYFRNHGEIDSMSTVASLDLLAKSRQERVGAVGATIRDTR